MTPNKLTAQNLTLPEYVQVCPWCNGDGQTKQSFIEGRIYSTCECCAEPEVHYFMRPASGFVWKGTTKWPRGVPESIVHQILTTNAVTRVEGRYPPTWVYEPTETCEGAKDVVYG